MANDVSQLVQAPLRSLMGVQVLATGSYVPDLVVRNEDLARLGFDADWIIQRTGIRERRHAPKEIATSDMAVAAARRCIEQAGINTRDIDLVLLGTFTPDMPAPSTACQVQTQLGLVAPAMDIQAACAGFMYALITGMQFVATGCSRLALVIGADTNSRIIDPDDHKIFPLFGDGAGAILLAPGSRDQGLVSYALGADGSGMELLYTPAGGSRSPTCVESIEQKKHYLQMDGRPVFKWAVRMLEQSVNDVLRKAELTVDDLDLVVLHQANVRILDAAAECLGLCRDKLVVNLDRYGNTSAGSIPLALDEVFRQGRIRRGSKVLISGFGAGLAWGTGILQW